MLFCSLIYPKCQLFPCRVGGELVVEVRGVGVWGYTKTNSEGQFSKVASSPSCMSLDSGAGRRPEGTHADMERTCKLHTEKSLAPMITMITTFAEANLVSLFGKQGEALNQPLLIWILLCMIQL